MTETVTVTAIYEQGMLRPLQPLNLQEHQRVRIQVLPEEAEAQKEPKDEMEALIQRLVTAGLMRPRPKRDAIPPDPLSEEERQALADRLGRAPGKSASEMVIEDRGEW